MKPHRFLLILAGPFALFPALLAVETVRIDSVIYVFKAAAFDHISAKALTLSPAHAAVFTAPVEITFDQQTLSLNGSAYAWNGDRKAPAQFSVTGMPAMMALLGQPATILCAAPAQYLEKMPDGSLQLRTTPPDSPDMPHYQLTLTVRSGATGFVTACDLDVVALQGREKIPGVDLEVGRPTVARFKDSVEIPNPTSGWSCMVMQRPGGSDCSLLMLLKVSSAGSSQGSAARPMKPVAPPK